MLGKNQRKFLKPVLSIFTRDFSSLQPEFCFDVITGQLTSKHAKIFQLKSKW